MPFDNRIFRNALDPCVTEEIEQSYSRLDDNSTSPLVFIHFSGVSLYSDGISELFCLHRKFNDMIFGTSFGRDGKYRF